MRAFFGFMGLAFGLTASQSALADPCTAPLPSRGTDFSGQVRYVGDGDSLFGIAAIMSAVIR